MELNVKESLSLFVVNVLMFQRSIRSQNAEIQLVKECLLQATLLCEESYMELQDAPSRVAFNKAMKACLNELQKANYWLRILHEAKMGDRKKVGVLIEDSNWIKGNLEQVRSITKKRLIPAQGVAA